MWWLLGIAVVVAAVTGSVLVLRADWFIADDEHSSRVRAASVFHPLLLVFSGVVIACLAVVFFPEDTGMTSEPGYVAWAPLSNTTFSPPIAGTLDVVLLGICVGTAAGATPFLIGIDLLVHRLPDRIVLPLIGLQFFAYVTGLIWGNLSIWTMAFISGVIASALFGLLVLIGRLMRARTMGLGDVKLAFLVGGIAGLYSPWGLAPVLVAAVLIAAIAALLEVTRTKRLKDTSIAFGPALLSGMWLGSVLAPILL